MVRRGARPRRWSTRSVFGSLLACLALVGVPRAAAQGVPVPADPGPLEAPGRVAGTEADGPGLASNEDWTATEAGRAALFDLVTRRVEEIYWNPRHLDWEAWRARHRDGVLAAETPEALDRAFRRAFEDVGDDHTRWLGVEGSPPSTRAPTTPADPAPGEPGREDPTPEDPGPDEPPSTDPGTPGVAASAPRLGADVRPLEGHGLLIVRVHPGGAADAAGLLRGDVIVSVDEASLAQPGLGWGMRRVVTSALRRGAATVSIDRTRSRMTATVEPRVLPAGAEARPLAERAEDFSAARLEIPTFANGTAEFVHAELAALAASGVRYLILDLRGNPGGSVAEMGLVLGAFMDGEPLAAHGRGGVSWRMRIDRSGDELDVRLARDEGRLAGQDAAVARMREFTRWDGPVAILVDGGTASAAEAFAGTLAGALDAPVVGSTTPGNVETIRRIAFPAGRAAMVAVGDLRRADGEPVAPVPLTAEARLDPAELARGLDAPFADAIRLLRGFSWTPGTWF